MTKYYFVIVIFLLSFIYSFAQKQDKKQEVFQGIEVNGDTIPLIELQEVVIHPSKKQSRKYRRRIKYYRKLIYNVRVAYPYAKLANKKLGEMNEHFLSLDRSVDQKKYIKEAEKVLVKEFSDELKNLTVSQGRILIKLIDRETGNTSYEIIKELRGAFRAFFWQTLARLFGSNLKSEYSPRKEDLLIERIVIMLEQGRIKPIPRRPVKKKKKNK